MDVDKISQAISEYGLKEALLEVVRPDELNDRVLQILWEVAGDAVRELYIELDEYNG